MFEPQINDCDVATAMFFFLYVLVDVHYLLYICCHF